MNGIHTTGYSFGDVTGPLKSTAVYDRHTGKVIDEAGRVHHPRKFLVLRRRQCQHVTLQDGRVLRVLLEQLVHGGRVRAISAGGQRSRQLLLLLLLLLT